MARSGAFRGMITRPARRTFAITPATRTAAASRLSRVGDGTADRRKAAGWQSDALTYYETLPPVGFVMDFKANTVAACDLNVVQQTDDGPVPVEDNEQIDRLMAALVGPRGETAELLRRAAVLVEVTGEAYFVGTPVDDESEAVWWEFLSVEEILPPTESAVGLGYQRDRGLGGGKETLPPETHIARFWRSDARFSSRASCGLRRCLATCRELVLLSQMTEAIIASRLPMGLLLLPDTIEHESPLHRRDDAQSLSDDAAADESSLMDDLIDHLSTPITDFESASTLVPLVLQANKDDLASIKVVDLARSLDGYAAGLREEMYGRLAVGLDVPPEILQGKGGLNHWTGSNIDNEFLFKHVQPVGNLICDFLTYAYLRPMLIAEGVDVQTAADFRIEFDAAPLANNEDDHLKAKSLWDDLLVSDRFTVEKQGWDPTTAMPEEDERVRRLVERLVMAKIVSLSEAGAKYLGLDPEWFDLSAPAEPPAFGEPPALPPGQPTPQPGLNPDQQGTPPNPGGEPGQDPQPETAPGQRAAAAELIRLLGARADGVYDSVRRTAGSRIIRAAQRHPQHKGRFASVQTEEVPAALSPAELAALGLSPADCVDRAAWTEFRSMAYAGLVSLLVSGGIEAAPAADAASRISDRLADDLHRWTVDGFHRPFARYVPGKGPFKVPASVIAAAVEEACRPTVRVA